MNGAFLKASFVAAIIVAGVSPAIAADAITFNNQVVRILQQHCQTCHRPGNIAPFPLLTFTDVRTRATQIRRAVEAREMPPWKPVNPAGTFEGERLLSTDEIDTILKWVDSGAPEGAASDLPASVTFPDTWNAGQPDIVARPDAPYTLQPNSADIYRCYSLPVDSTSDLYVRGFEIIPGNRAVVHHVLLFTDTNGQSAALDDADPEPGYSCFGGAGFTLGIGGLGAWAPGASPLMFPLGTGIRIAKGSRIVMQVHYSTLDATASGAPLTPDRTSLGLYLSPVPLSQITILPIVNFSFQIPAGARNHEVHAFLSIPIDAELVNIGPHMHLLGRDATVTARFPNGTSRNLIEIDDWDFHWQGIYTYREPIVLPAGTMLELVAHYDNSTDNPRNPNNPPVDVRWGERTVDEMCLAFISVKAVGTPSVNTVPFSVSDRGASSVVTTGVAGTPQIGYARVAGTSGSTASGLAIFGYRQNGILISEAGVPASPLIVQGRIAAEAGAGAYGPGYSEPELDGNNVVVLFHRCRWP
jgi:mono/diheme cytochrome c family protein